MEDQKDNNRKTPQTSPISSSVDTFTPKPSKSSIKQLGNQSSVSVEVGDQRCETLATLLGCKITEIL